MRLNGIRRPRTFSVIGLLAIIMASADGHEGPSVPPQTKTKLPQSASVGHVDITNVLFNRHTGDCEAYIGSYFSKVLDIQRELAFSGKVFISTVNNKCRIKSNDIPNHDFDDHSAAFATPVSEQNDAFEFTMHPAFAARVSGLKLGQTNAIMLNGVVLDILAAACYGVGNEPLGRERIGCGPNQMGNPWRYDPMSPLNGFGTDVHNAHVQPNGKYHYHGNPVAMFAQNCSAQTVISPVIGFAADGFPIYGSCIRDRSTGKIRQARASYRLKNNGGPRQAVENYETPKAGVGLVASANYDGQFRGDWTFQAGVGDLDECNGMTVNGQYGYYVTDAFPWVMNCYKGIPDSSFSAKGPDAFRMKMHRHPIVFDHAKSHQD